MQDENVVRDLNVSDRNRTIKASYFVENGVLHANVKGRILVLPIGADGSEETVRRLVLGQMHMRTWRGRILDRWIRRSLKQKITPTV